MSRITPFDPTRDTSPKSKGGPGELTAAGNELAGLLLGLVQPINPFQDVQQTAGATPTIDERISTLVTDILPSYIGEDHPTFVLFMKAFYEFLEEESGTRYEAVKLQTYFDIDQTLDEFVQFFLQQYAVGFNPSGRELDSGMSNRQLVRRVNEYYKEKGGTISVQLLFRMLFGKEADVIFPRDALFEVSGGDFTEVSTIKVSRLNTADNLKSVEGGQIIQYPTNYRGQAMRGSDFSALAFIDKINVSTINGVDQTTLTVKDVRGTFLPNQEVDLVKGSTLLQEDTFDLIAGITIQNAGKDFVVGDGVQITDSSGRIVATSVVENVGVSGDLKRFKPFNVKNVYLPYETYTITVDSNGSGATLELLTGYGNSPKRKERQSSESTLSSKSVIQDNFRDQQHSYVIKVEEQLSKFKSIVLDILHPAGSKLFSEHLILRKFAATTFDVLSPQSSTTSDNPTRFGPAIGHFTPYIFSGTTDIRGETYGTTFADYYPTGFNGLTAATLGLFASGQPVTHDPITSGFTIGAMGGPSAGTQNPEAFGVTFSVNAGVTLPGYTVENIDQKIQVSGTDSITAPFWIIYKHPKNALISPPASNLNSFTTVKFNLDPAGFTIGHFLTGMTIGSVVVQRSSDRPTAIGDVVGITDENASGSKFAAVRAKGGTLAVVVTIAERNGLFTNVPNQDGTRRLLLNTDTGFTFDTIGTGGINFDKVNSAIERFAFEHLNIGEFINETIY